MSTTVHRMADPSWPRTAAERKGVDDATVADPPMAHLEMDAIPGADDATGFAHEVSAPTAGLSPHRLATLADQMRSWIEEGRMAQGLSCDFSVEVRELGTLSGRLSITPHGADLELLASRPALAAVLRSRLPVLQALVRHDSGGDVNLSVR